MEKLLKFLSGKKGIIAVCLGLITTYLATKGIIGEPELALFGGMQLAFFGGLSYQTKQMFNGKAGK